MDISSALPASPRRPRRWPWLLLLGLLLLAGLGVLRLQRMSAESTGPLPLTQPADTGRIARVLQISGTLQPVQQVQVGTQVSGVITRLHVDYNDLVKPGQLLAEIDTRTLDAELAAAQGALTALQAQARNAEQKLARQRQLVAEGFISAVQLDDFQAQRDAASAQVQQQAALLARAQNNRRMAEIRSPVAGTVTAREVAVGQTVAAAFNTPLLFRIAQDLTEMQVEAAVSEADVGVLREGQAVQYSVDAFPDRVFEGRLTQIRNNFAVQQNVVTYTVLIRTQNPEKLLRPGMTAYLKVQVAERARALRVPNSALRFKGPEPVELAPGEGLVWRADAQGALTPVRLRLGLSDGQYTEVLDGAPLKSGEALAIGYRPQAAQFGPRFF
jgi:HlyD family secretion protein